MAGRQETNLRRLFTGQARKPLHYRPRGARRDKIFIYYYFPFSYYLLYTTQHLYTTQKKTEIWRGTPVKWNLM